MIRLLAYRNFHANTHSHLKTTTHRPPLGHAEPRTRKACIDASLHEKLVKQTRPRWLLPLSTARSANWHGVSCHRGQRMLKVRLF